MNMETQLRLILEFDGVYGGPQSRDRVIRTLRDAIALLENTQTQDIFCTPFRIEALGEEEES
ncbi:MAG: hypothetical protein U0822_03380 [Anaerolineae bacterium]